MARSLKKGPFCDHHLMKKVEEAVATDNIKAVIKTCLEDQQYSLTL